MLIGYLMAKWAASIGFFFTMLWGYNWHMMVGRSAGFVRLQNDIKWLLILSTSYCGYKQQFRVYGFVQKLDLRMGNDDDDGDDDWGSSSGIGIGPLKKNDLALVRRCICGCCTSLDSKPVSPWTAPESCRGPWQEYRIQMAQGLGCTLAPPSTSPFSRAWLGGIRVKSASLMKFMSTESPRLGNRELKPMVSAKPEAGGLPSSCPCWDG